jgi:hypothetical protein
MARKGFTVTSPKKLHRAPEKQDEDARTTANEIQIHKRMAICRRMKTSANSPTKSTAICSCPSHRDESMQTPIDSDRTYQIFKREADNTTVCIEV